VKIKDNSGLEGGMDMGFAIKLLKNYAILEGHASNIFSDFAGSHRRAKILQKGKTSP